MNIYVQNANIYLAKNGDAKDFCTNSKLVKESIASGFKALADYVNKLDARLFTKVHK